VEDNRCDIIPKLLKSGVRPQETALKLAVLQGDESMVRLLLDGGLRVLEYGYSGLYAAEMNGRVNVVNLLKSRGGGRTTRGRRLR
jgi:ankyrin repeat protein